MSDTFFKEVHYSLDGLINDIGLSRIGLPDIQRPFVWANAKVRDLFDSMYRGYPVGYFFFWQTGAEGADTKVIGDQNKQKTPSLLIVDGQQRLTSLYAVIRREAVLRENFEHEHIRIAFRPQTGLFAVPDATTERDPEYILDISEVFNRPTHKTISEYLGRLSAAREVSEAEEDKIADAIGRPAALTNFPFIALELSQQSSEEQVADVFVRINSEGKKLNQSDFILTLMSVFGTMAVPNSNSSAVARVSRHPSGSRARLTIFFNRTRIIYFASMSVSPSGGHVSNMCIRCFVGRICLRGT